MPSFLADENITRNTVDRLNKVGLSTVHVKYDLHSGGIDDPSVVMLGKKKKLTVLTNNNKDFQKNIDKGEIKSGQGIWCLETADPNEQVKRATAISKTSELNSKKKRKSKLVTYTGKGVHIEDCSTNKTTFISWEIKK